MADFTINVVVNNRGAVDGSRQVGQQLSAIERTAKSLITTFAALFTLRQITAFARQVSATAESFNQIQRAATIAAGATGSAAAQLDAVVDTARRAGSELETTSQVYTRFALAGRAAGLEQAELNRITDTLVRGFAIFTGSAAEANSAITQLSQAFSSGRLAGDEFRSVSENFPPLLNAISEVTGVATSDLREFAAEGNITSDVLIEAFRRLEDTVRSLEDTIEQTLQQILNRVRNEFTLLVGNIDDAIGATELFRDAAESVGDTLQRSRVDTFGGTVAELSDRLAELLVEQEEVTRAAEEQNPVIAALFGAYADLDRNAERLAAVQVQLSLNFAEVTRQIRDADAAATFFGSTQGQLLQDLAATADAQELQARAVFNSLNAYQALRAELVQLETTLGAQEAAQKALEEQGERLAETFDFLRRNTAESQRELARVDATVAALPQIFREFEAETRRLNEQARLADEAFENLRQTFGRFAGTDLINVLENISSLLGDDLTAQFGELGESIAAAFGVDTTTFNNALSGTLGLLGELGFELEDVFGRRGAQAIQLLGSISNEEFSAIGDVVSGAVDGIAGLFGGGEGSGEGFLSGIATGIANLFGTAEESVSSFGQSSFGTLTSFNSSIEDLQAVSVDATAATEELGASVGEIGTASEQNLGSILATAGAIAGLAGSIAQAAGATEAGQFGATVGAGIGAIIGGATGIPGGAIVGGAAGGAAFGFLGNLIGREELSAEEQRLREIGERLAIALRDGFAATFAELGAELDADELEAVIDQLDRTVGRFNESLISTEQALAAINASGVEGFTRIAAVLDAIAVTTSTQLQALGNSAAVAADLISETFNINLTDVLAFFNALPPGVADSFDNIQANAEQIAVLLREQFGLSVDEVIALFEDLGIRVEDTFANIEDPAQFLAAKLADNFDVAVLDILEILNGLEEGTIDSFADLFNNVDVLAANIATSLGVTFEEAREIILRFAEESGISLSELGTTADDLAVDLLDGFSLSAGGIRNLFFGISRSILDELDNIAVGADGTFRLIDDEAQATLEKLFQVVGGTSEDLQLLLSTLANNADISFADIFSSGTLAFQNLSAETIRELSAILANTEFTAEQIANLFGGIAADGVTSFEQLEKQASVTLANVLLEFGASEAQITDILQAIAESGETSFSDIEGAGGEALRQLLLDFGITEDQIKVIFNQIALGADSGFADIGIRGGQTAEELQTIFRAALEFIAGLFGNLEGVVGSDLATIGAQASATGNIISASFSGAARSAASAFSSIRADAARAQAAVQAVAAANRRAQFVAQGFAEGGVITGPVALGGAGAGQAFASGGILGGLTSILGAGSVLATNQLGIAGEAGPEAIMPLTPTSNGLGVTATFPPELLQQLENLAGNNNGGPTIIRETKIMIFEGVDRTETDEIRSRVESLDASIETRSEVVTTDILSEVAA